MAFRMGSLGLRSLMAGPHPIPLPQAGEGRLDVETKRQMS